MRSKPCLGRWIPTAALCLLGGVSEASTSINLGNFAPRDNASGGTLSIYLNGSAAGPALPYGSLIEGLPAPSGSVDVRVLDEEGTTLIEREIVLASDAVSTLYAVGNGTSQPVDIRVLEERIEPLDPYASTRDWYSAAIHSSALHASTVCGDALGNSGGVLPLYYDAGHPAPSGDMVRISTAPRASSGSYNAGSWREVMCEMKVREGNEHGQLVALGSFTPIEGGLQRIVVTGDGSNQPWEVLVFDSAEKAKAVVIPTQKMEGLWYDPTDSGSGLSIMLGDADDAGAIPVTAIFYGYDRDGYATWSLLEGKFRDRKPYQQRYSPQMPLLDPFWLRFQQPIGLSPDGRLQPSLIAIGRGTIAFHSCREATLVLDDAGDRLPRHLGSSPGRQTQVFRLANLTPNDDCAPIGAGQNQIQENDR